MALTVCIFAIKQGHYFWASSWDFLLSRNARCSGPCSRRVVWRGTKPVLRSVLLLNFWLQITAFQDTCLMLVTVFTMGPMIPLVFRSLTALLLLCFMYLAQVISTLLIDAFPRALETEQVACHLCNSTLGTKEDLLVKSVLIIWIAVWFILAVLIWQNYFSVFGCWGFFIQQQKVKFSRGSLHEVPGSWFAVGSVRRYSNKEQESYLITVTEFQLVSFFVIHCLFSWCSLMNLNDSINASWVIVIQGMWILFAVRYGIIIFQSCYEMDFVPSVRI